METSRQTLVTASPLVLTRPLPAGPDAPAWTQAQAWIENPTRFWRECQEQFGDVFTVQLGSLGPTVLFSHPEAVRQVFQLPTTAFECRHYNEQYKYVMGAQSVLVSDGPQNRRRRSLFTPLMQGPAVREVASIVQEVTRDTVGKWPRNQPFAVRSSLHLLSLAVILRVVFGDEDCEVQQQLLQLYRTQVYHELGAWGPWSRIGKLSSEVRAVIAAASERRRQRAAKKPAMLDVLVHARDEQGQLLDPGEICDHVNTLMVAGVDTVAIATTWALYWLLRHPAELARLRQELAALPDDAGAVALLELPYLKAVCQESLRMYPVVNTPSGRKLTQDRRIMDQEFEAGVILLPCTYLVHHRSDLYPDPDRFDPSRFLRRTYSPFEYFPFGGGARTCIGSALGFMEFQVALATIVSNCELEPAHTGEVEPTRHGTLLAPSDAMRVQVLDATLPVRGEKV